MTLSAQLVELVRRREQVDNLASALLPSRSPVFGSVSLGTPDVEGAAELGFIRTASWLYAFYFEVGRVGVRFLIKRNATAPVAHGQGHGHLDLVQALRTWSQHNVDPISARHDARIMEICENWFQANSATRVPRSEAHFRRLLECLLSEAVDFFALLLQLLSDLESEANRDIICQQWEDRLHRDWPAHRYHELIAVAAVDLGRESLDAVAFYGRYGHVIRDSMLLVSDVRDLETEARKRIESLLLKETAAIIPISGQDVIEFFAIKPGPQVGEILRSATRLCESESLGRDDLLSRLAEEFAHMKAPPESRAAE